jgi:O-methyltransferase involved in polyketide biosynthesis
MSPAETISPTAHYTGYVWARHGLSHPELATREGRLLFEATRPWLAASRALDGPTLETYLLARHRAIDALLERAITEEGVTQVVEVAAGLSPRGWRFTQRFEQLTYVEADLPGMATRKRSALERMGSLGPRHRVEVLDARLDSGPESLAELVERLDRSRGLVMITEGLLGYLDRESVLGLWRRFASALQRFEKGFYFSDLPLGGRRSTQVRAFAVVLGAFVRGRVHLHFGEPSEAVALLKECAFARAAVRPAAEVADVDPGSDPGASFAHVIDAQTGTTSTGSDSRP